jgi:DNA-3-methyladenine glycosylase
MSILSPSYFQQEHVVTLAEELIGCKMNAISDGIHCSGIVAETEAYEGITDKASHAYMGRKTDRTSVMYRKGGVAYVYLCYGMHYLFNVVTAGENVPHAILIRAVLPCEGVETMQRRRGENIRFEQLANGPVKTDKSNGNQNGT